ncbi:PREDICTED: t-SNARE domain-containing protein 1-like, partial [Sturnus vulgaris]
GLLKRKPNFTLQELEVLMSEVLRYEPLLFGAAAGTVNAYEKQKIWWRITHKVNAAGRHQRDIGEVKNRWRGLRRRAGDKISRHRLERQGPAGRASA